MTPPPNAVRVLRLLQFWHTPEAAARSLRISPRDVRVVEIWARVRHYVIRTGRRVKATRAGLEWADTYVPPEVLTATEAERVSEIMRLAFDCGQRGRVSAATRKLRRAQATERREVFLLAADHGGAVSVEWLSERSGLSPPTVAARMRALRDAGAVTQNRRGRPKVTVYTVTGLGGRVASILRERRAA